VSDKKTAHNTRDLPPAFKIAHSTQLGQLHATIIHNFATRQI